MNVELVTEAHSQIGESVTWVPEERALYWIDVRSPALYRIDPASGVVRSWTLPSEVGGFALRRGRPGAVVALRSGIHELNMVTGGISLLAAPPYDPARFRFNEAACDSQGRLWLGTMYEPQHPWLHVRQPGILHHYTSATGLVPHADAAFTPNGMAWSVDERVFYVSHSEEHAIHAFPFDPDAGSLGQRREFARVPAELGVPDGAAMDEEGCYWAAIHGGSRLRRFAPDGRVREDVMLPVSQPTMCAFGGPELDMLYVTSAREGLSSKQLHDEPHAGGLLRLRPNVCGLPRQCHVV